MKISILSTDSQHPVVKSLEYWRTRMISKGHEVSLLYAKSALNEGDILFLVSCGELIKNKERAKFGVVLVLHASDLPHGRGWSPHVWSIVEGQSEITVSLLEACDPVDTGPIWFKESFNLGGHELLPEVNEKLFAAELNLMDRAVAEFGSMLPRPQAALDSTHIGYRRKRTSMDSRLDPFLSISEQFDLLRVVHNERYPAFFELRGHKYKLSIEKFKNE